MNDTNRKILMVVGATSVAVLMASSDAIQRWRAERQLRALAPGACQSTVDPKRCTDGIVRHHARCLARGILGTAPTGVVVNPTAYADCILAPPPPDPREEISSQYGAARACPPSQVNVLLADAAKGLYAASGCGKAAYYKCNKTECAPVETEKSAPDSP